MTKLFDDDNHRHADPFDRIQEWNEIHQQVSLMNQLARAAVAAPIDFDGEHCVDCDAPVEGPRLALRLFVCSECAHYRDREADAERRNGRAE